LEYLVFTSLTTPVTRSPNEEHSFSPEHVTPLQGE
jgi:hypothetical protein